MDYASIGLRIHQLRIERGMKQRELAKAAGISESFYGHIEHGNRVMSIETLVALASALGTSTDYLLGLQSAALPLTLTDNERKVAESALDAVLSAIRQ